VQPRICCYFCTAHAVVVHLHTKPVAEIHVAALGLWTISAPLAGEQTTFLLRMWAFRAPTILPCGM
jgi:hypothetical protein